MAEEEEGEGRKKTLVGGTACPPLQSVIFLRWGKLWTCLTLSPCWTWVQNRPFLCTQGWRKVWNTKTCHCLLPWAWRMPCPKARVGLWPAESAISSMPVELCVGSRRLSGLFCGTPGMQAWRNQDQLREQQTKTEQLPVKWNKMPSKLGLQNKEFATSLLPVPKQFIFWSWLSLLPPPAPPATSQVISKSLSWAS